MYGYPAVIEREMIRRNHMESSPAKIFIGLFSFTHDGVLHTYVNGITQAESLLQPLSGGNCMNWTIGHILETYNTLLEWLGFPAIISVAEAGLYGYDSEPMTDPAKASDLQDMLKRLDEGKEKITSRVASLSTAELEREIEIWRGKVTLIEALMDSMWHVTYHSGQFEQLRQLAGKKEKVV
jgi:uncharacterized damage-inducible protein DinB